MRQEDKNVHWFVLGTRKRNSEVQICDDIRHQEDLECFLPMVYRIRHVNNRRHEALEPAIRGFIFARGTEAGLADYMTRSAYGLYFRKAWFSENKEIKDKLIVDDESMDNFMRFIQSNQKSVRFYKPDEITWVEGDVVKVMIGSAIYEGQIVRIKGKTRFSVNIRESVFATIELTPDLIQSAGKDDIIQYNPDAKTDESIERTADGRKKRKVRYEDRDRRKSNDVEADKKLLTETAWRVLFDLDGNCMGTLREYHIACREVERAMNRLSTYHGVTAALEGELALAMFLGSMAIGGNREEAEKRLRAAHEKLSDSSMLKLRIRFYLAKLTDDVEDMSGVMDEIKKWDARNLMPKQREFLNETRNIRQGKTN